MNNKIVLVKENVSGEVKEEYINKFLRVRRYDEVDNQYELCELSGERIKENNRVLWWKASEIINANIELEVGKKVKLKELKRNTEYGDVVANTYMAQFGKKEVTIKNIGEDFLFEIEEDPKGKKFSIEMIELDGEEIINEEDFSPIPDDELYLKRFPKSLKVGDKLLVRDMKDGGEFRDDFGGHSPYSSQRDLSYKFVTVARVYEKEKRIYVDEDNCEDSWYPAYFLNTEFKEIFNKSTYISKKIAINVVGEKGIKKFLKMATEAGAKWVDGTPINKEDYSKIGDNTIFTMYEPNRSKRKDLLIKIDERSYFEDNQFLLKNIRNIFFENGLNKSSMEKDKQKESLNEIEMSALKDRGICIGDIYQIEGSPIEENNGWYLASNGFSIKLNCKEGTYGQWNGTAVDLNNDPLKRIIIANRNFDYKILVARLIDDIVKGREIDYNKYEGVITEIV